MTESNVLNKDDQKNKAINQKQSIKGLNGNAALESDEAPQLQDKWIPLNLVAFCSSLEPYLTYQGVTHGYGLSPFLFILNSSTLRSS